MTTKNSKLFNNRCYLIWHVKLAPFEIRILGKNVLFGNYVLDGKVTSNISLKVKLLIQAAIKTC